MRRNGVRGAIWTTTYDALGVDSWASEVEYYRA
jgi:hypothetical protein